LREPSLDIEEPVQLFVEGDEVFRHYDGIINKNVRSGCDWFLAVLDGSNLHIHLQSKDLCFLQSGI
jgi:hypothetical protein